MSSWAADSGQDVGKYWGNSHSVQSLNPKKDEYLWFASAVVRLLSFRNVNFLGRKRKPHSWHVIAFFAKKGAFSSPTMRYSLISFVKLACKRVGRGRVVTIIFISVTTLIININNKYWIANKIKEKDHVGVVIFISTCITGIKDHYLVRGQRNRQLPTTIVLLTRGFIFFFIFYTQSLWIILMASL